VNGGVEQAEGVELRWRGRRMVRSCEIRKVNGSKVGARRDKSGVRKMENSRWQRGENAQGSEPAAV
jgi:hypothetical protein